MILANSYHVGRVPRHPRCVGERLRIAGKGNNILWLVLGGIGFTIITLACSRGRRGVGKLVWADEIVW